jgi:hypothetical protein
VRDKNYKYVLVGDKYWCTSQNLLKLICYKFLKKDFFVAKDLNLKFFLTLLFCQLKLIKASKEIAINQKAQFLIKVHGGFKLFDLYKKRVLKKYNFDNKKNIFKKEFEQLQIIQSLNCSPYVSRVNAEEIFYEEQYSRAIIDLEKAIYTEKEITRIFNEHLIPILIEIIKLENPIHLPLGDYLKKIDYEINHSAIVHSNRKSYEVIKNFVNQTTDKLKSFEQFYIYLSYTHGDLSTKNMILSNDGIKLIDWEFFRKRNLFFDFYNFFFHMLRKNRQINIDLNSIIEKCFVNFKNLLKDYLDENNIGNLNRIYRLLYYLERVLTIIEFRELVTPEKKIRNILYNIEVFKFYEDEN